MIGRGEGSNAPQRHTRNWNLEMALRGKGSTGNESFQAYLSPRFNQLGNALYQHNNLRDAAETDRRTKLARTS